MKADRVKKLFSDQRLFFQQFRERFHTTGAILPSSRMLAKAMTGPFEKRNHPARLLEIGPGTGAVTKRIVRLLQPGDSLDLVELNKHFADALKERFQADPVYQRVQDLSRIHVCPLQEFETEGNYDFIISGLPLNNFSAELVREIFGIYFELLKPGGSLSYFEYMYIRSIKKVITKKEERDRLRKLDSIAASYLDQYRFHRSWVFVNFPPAWVQHLQKDEEVPPVDDTSQS